MANIDLAAIRERAEQNHPGSMYRWVFTQPEVRALLNEIDRLTTERDGARTRAVTRAFSLDRVRAHVAEWAARECIAGNAWHDSEGNAYHVACFQCAAAEITRTIDGEGTDA